MLINKMLRSITLNEEMINSIKRHILIGSPEQCWPWCGSKNIDGYGKLSNQNKYYRAHRVAYVIAYGEFDWELLVCHKCDNPPCCNPFHLFLGTQSVNKKDSFNKGRNNVQGENAGNSKLIESQIIEIQLKYASGFSQQYLAREYGVNQSQISYIINHKQWKHTSI